MTVILQATSMFYESCIISMQSRCCKPLGVQRERDLEEKLSFARCSIRPNKVDFKTLRVLGVPNLQQKLNGQV